ncbi:hypothetical protein LCGC14_2603450, partial [marine sediment metagenome]
LLLVKVTQLNKENTVLLKQVETLNKDTRNMLERRPR